MWCNGICPNPKNFTSLHCFPSQWPLNPRSQWFYASSSLVLYTADFWIRFLPSVFSLKKIHFLYVEGGYFFLFHTEDCFFHSWIVMQVSFTCSWLLLVLKEKPVPAWLVIITRMICYLLLAKETSEKNMALLLCSLHNRPKVLCIVFVTHVYVYASSCCLFVDVCINISSESPKLGNHLYCRY